MCVCVIVLSPVRILSTRLMSDLLLLFNVLQISPDGLGLPDRNYYYREPDHAVIISFDFCASRDTRSLRAARGMAKGGLESLPNDTIQGSNHTLIMCITVIQFSTCDSVRALAQLHFTTVSLNSPDCLVFLFCFFGFYSFCFGFV